MKRGEVYYMPSKVLFIITDRMKIDGDWIIYFVDERGVNAFLEEKFLKRNKKVKLVKEPHEIAKMQLLAGDQIYVDKERLERKGI